MVTQAEGTAFTVNLLYSDGGSWKVAAMDEGMNENDEPYFSWSWCG